MEGDILQRVIQEIKTYGDLDGIEDIRPLGKALENLIARNKELEEVVKTYNAIPNDYMGNDIKIVIADREYFNDGILKENLIPKSKVREKIEELIKEADYRTKDNLKGRVHFQSEPVDFQIAVLQELLQEGDDK